MYPLTSWSAFLKIREFSNVFLSWLVLVSPCWAWFYLDAYLPQHETSYSLATALSIVNGYWDHWIPHATPLFSALFLLMTNNHFEVSHLLQSTVVLSLFFMTLWLGFRFQSVPSAPWLATGVILTPSLYLQFFVIEHEALFYFSAFGLLLISYRPPLTTIKATLGILLFSIAIESRPGETVLFLLPALFLQNLRRIKKTSSQNSMYILLGVCFLWLSPSLFILLSLLDYSWLEKWKIFGALQIVLSIFAALQCLSVFPSNIPRWFNFGLATVFSTWTFLHYSMDAMQVWLVSNIELGQPGRYFNEIHSLPNFIYLIWHCILRVIFPVGIPLLFAFYLGGFRFSRDTTILTIPFLITVLIVTFIKQFAPHQLVVPVFFFILLPALNSKKIAWTRGRLQLWKVFLALSIFISYGILGAKSLHLSVSNIPFFSSSIHSPLPLPARPPNSALHTYLNSLPTNWYEPDDVIGVYKFTEIEPVHHHITDISGETLFLNFFTRKKVKRVKDYTIYLDLLKSHFTTGLVDQVLLIYSRHPVTLETSKKITEKMKDIIDDYKAYGARYEWLQNEIVLSPSEVIPPIARIYHAHQ